MLESRLDSGTTSTASSVPLRFVVHSERLGVFLGDCMGLDFWSRLDPVGQDAAATFRSEADAQAFIARVGEHCTSAGVLRAVAVNPELGDYASVADCVKAGLPAWNPNAEPNPGA